MATPPSTGMPEWRLRNSVATRDGIAPPHSKLHTSHNAAIRAHLPPAAGQPGETPATAGELRVPAHTNNSARKGRPADPAARAASAAALQNLIDDPAQLAVVRRWLRPEHFEPAENKALYAVLQDMHVAGKPVDPVTVTWEAARRGLQTQPARLTGGVGSFAVWSAREVRRLGNLAHISAAGAALESDAADPAHTPLRLLQSAENRLQSFREEPELPAGPQMAARANQALRQVAAWPCRQPEREATQ
jgi:DnaB-like helicase N terminal domain